MKCKNPRCDASSLEDDILCKGCQKIVMKRFHDGYLNCPACERWLKGEYVHDPTTPPPWQHGCYIECEPAMVMGMSIAQHLGQW